ncbi:MAG: selenide, water dikinase SelD [Bacteroidota bacterium]
MTEFRLTKFSHGGGCGCKIAPSVLSSILQSSIKAPEYKNLLVGNASNDDAAAYDLGNGTALISTTDFFMPIVDDAFSFGKIASANSISDVYAMGGKPILAIAILGWPIDKIPAEIAQQLLEGARSICLEAGIPLAGGHSIDSPEPIFGLAVSGLVDIENLKRNNTAKENDLLFLTKPIGVGIIATAQKREKISEKHLEQLLKQLSTLNKAGEALGKIAGVHAMTDVTGFGLIGHLTEMAEGSKLSAEITYANIPILDAAIEYQKQKIGPGATARNWNSYSAKVSIAPNIDQEEALQLLPDPQTNGGLLISVAPESAEEVIAVLESFGLTAHVQPIGKMVAQGDKIIQIL